ncbi:MAG: cache domain-containing protein, partial [Caldimonas sp.]
MSIITRSRVRYALGSLKFRLTVASVLLIGLSVAFTVFFVLRDLGHRSEQAALDIQLGEAQRLATVLSSRLVSLQNSLRSATRGLTPESLSSAPARTAFLDDAVVLRSLFDSVFLAATDGRMLALIDSDGAQATGGAVGDRAYFVKTLAEQRSVISEPIVGRKSGEPMVAMTMPIIDANGGTAGVLAGGLKLSVRTLMGDLTRSGGTEYDPVTTIITDATGRIISHPDKDWLLRDAHAEPRIAGAVEQWIAQGRPIEPQGSSMRVGDYIVATAGVPDADWVVFRTAPAETLLGGPASGRRQAIWIGAAVAVAGGLLTLLATSFMLRPLRLLERRALRLLDDDMAAGEGWPRTGGELGSLSDVIQHVMSQRAASERIGDELFAKMRAVLGTAPVGIAFTRLSHFELVSSHFNRMFGYQTEQLIGQPTHLICTSVEEHRALGLRIAAAFAAGQMFDEELELARADGTRFWARRQGAPVVAGEIAAGTIWIITDITESRNQRERLSWA